MPSRLLALALSVAVLLMGHGIGFGSASAEAAWRQAAQPEVAAVVERGSVVAVPAAKADFGGEPPWGVLPGLVSWVGWHAPRLSPAGRQTASETPEAPGSGWAERERGPPILRA